MAKVNRPIRYVHIAQYAPPHIAQYDPPHIGQYAFAISPIYFHHIADIVISYRRYEYIISPIYYYDIV